jgi:hypothetical protein
VNRFHEIAAAFWQRFIREPLDPDSPPVEIQTGLLIFRSNTASTQAELQSSIRQKINRRSLPRYKHWMAKIVVEDIRADPKVLCCLGGADERRHGGDYVRKMIGDIESVITKTLDLAGLLPPL